LSMKDSRSESYRRAGVDVTAGYRAVELIKKHVKRTEIPGVLGLPGGFGGMFELDMSGIENPVLVSGTDGVGTKLKIAFIAGRHDTIGIDCVAMCVNDVICHGARPLFFLDYLALDKNIPEKVEEIVSGVAAGCVEAGCALIGGETAEMPGIYREHEYDLAGFCVGIADKTKILDPNNCREGDVVIGLASSGLHSNGYSLVRRVLDVENKGLSQNYPELGQNLASCLLSPTRIYVKPVLEAIKAGGVHSIAHITGGGFYENIPRALPDGLFAEIETTAFAAHPIFALISRLGNIPGREMFNTFNMGLGMVLTADSKGADGIMSALRNAGENPAIVGQLKKGERGVRL
jgi:phosphoribosylformylglycinamidine cyclo-ligase